VSRLLVCLDSTECHECRVEGFGCFIQYCNSFSNFEVRGRRQALPAFRSTVGKSLESFATLEAREKEMRRMTHLSHAEASRAGAMFHPARP
jgi:hypothetical protein